MILTGVIRSACSWAKIRVSSAWPSRVEPPAPLDLLATGVQARTLRQSVAYPTTDSERID